MCTSCGQIFTITSEDLEAIANQDDDKSLNLINYVEADEEEDEENDSKNGGEKVNNVDNVGGSGSGDVCSGHIIMDCDVTNSDLGIGTATSNNNNDVLGNVVGGVVSSDNVEVSEQSSVDLISTTDSVASSIINDTVGTKLNNKRKLSDDSQIQQQREQKEPQQPSKIMKRVQNKTNNNKNQQNISSVSISNSSVNGNLNGCSSKSTSIATTATTTSVTRNSK